MHNESCDFVKNPESFSACTNFTFCWINDNAFQVALISKNGDQVTIKGSETETIHVLLIGGVPLNEPIAHHGPFVMNTWEEIDQAIQDYHNGKLGKISGAEERYEKTRDAVQQQKNTGTWRDSL